MPHPAANPLDDMTWQERFHAAFEALLKMEVRAEDWERRYRTLKASNLTRGSTRSIIRPSIEEKQLTHRGYQLAWKQRNVAQDSSHTQRPSLGGTSGGISP